jgi:hypothetical protein
VGADQKSVSLVADADEQWRASISDTAKAKPIVNRFVFM